MCSATSAFADINAFQNESPCPRCESPLDCAAAGTAAAFCDKRKRTNKATVFRCVSSSLSISFSSTAYGIFTSLSISWHKPLNRKHTYYTTNRRTSLRRSWNGGFGDRPREWPVLQGVGDSRRRRKNRRGRQRARARQLRTRWRASGRGLNWRGSSCLTLEIVAKPLFARLTRQAARLAGTRWLPFATEESSIGIIAF